MRPSDYLGLSPSSWEAYQLDLAALELGRWVEGKRDERDKQGRLRHRMADLLRDAPEASPESYQSIAAVGTPLTKMAIPASGIW